MSTITQWPPVGTRVRLSPSGVRCHGGLDPGPGTVTAVLEDGRILVRHDSGCESSWGQFDSIERIESVFIHEAASTAATPVADDWPKVGDLVVLGRHDSYSVDGRPVNWASAMDKFVGTVARVNRCGNSALGKHVSVDGNIWQWHVKNLRRPSTEQLNRNDRALTMLRAHGFKVAVRDAATRSRSTDIPVGEAWVVRDSDSGQPDLFCCHALSRRGPDGHWRSTAEDALRHIGIVPSPLLVELVLRIERLQAQRTDADRQTQLAREELEESIDAARVEHVENLRKLGL